MTRSAYCISVRYVPFLHAYRNFNSLDKAILQLPVLYIIDESLLLTNDIITNIVKLPILTSPKRKAGFRPLLLPTQPVC